jgi:hypothetical protein
VRKMASFPRKNDSLGFGLIVILTQRETGVLKPVTVLSKDLRFCGWPRIEEEATGKGSGRTAEVCSDVTRAAFMGGGACAGRN